MSKCAVYSCFWPELVSSPQKWPLVSEPRISVLLTTVAVLGRVLAVLAVVQLDQEAGLLARRVGEPRHRAVRRRGEVGLDRVRLVAARRVVAGLRDLVVVAEVRGDVVRVAGREAAGHRQHRDVAAGAAARAAHVGQRVAGDRRVAVAVAATRAAVGHRVRAPLHLAPRCDGAREGVAAAGRPGPGVDERGEVVSARRSSPCSARRPEAPARGRAPGSSPGARSGRSCRRCRSWRRSSPLLAASGWRARRAGGRLGLARAGSTRLGLGLGLGAATALAMPATRTVAAASAGSTTIRIRRG